MPSRPLHPLAQLARLLLLTSVLLTSLLLAAGCAVHAMDEWDDEAPAEVQRAGLIATYRSLADAEPRVTRVEAKPALLVQQGSPHPAIAEGPFEAVWRGRLVWHESAPVRFFAFSCGELTVHVDGRRVLAGHGRQLDARLDPGEPIELAPGDYPIEVRFRSLAGHPARLQLWWKSAAFGAEPLPAWLLKHLPSDRPAEMDRWELAADGRELVGSLGCAGCHASALPGVSDPPPAPSLHDLVRRVDHDWLLQWLANPGSLREGAHMPQLFRPDREGYVERWVLAEFLLERPADDAGRPRPSDAATGDPLVTSDAVPDDHRADHRMGRRLFISVGCIACHAMPDQEPPEAALEQPYPAGPVRLRGLADRWDPATLTEFLLNPGQRYPHGPMPQMPLKPHEASDISAFLLLWSTPAAVALREHTAPTDEEVAALKQRAGAATADEAARRLLVEKGCVACHPGIVPEQSPAVAADVPLRSLHAGCLDPQPLPQPAPRFALDDGARSAIRAYLATAAGEVHAAPLDEARRDLQRHGCARCHRRDTDQATPLERVGSTLGSAWLQRIPSQRAPQLSFAHEKYESDYLLEALERGVHGVRDPGYTYRMPKFGDQADRLQAALAADDGHVARARDDRLAAEAADPTQASLFGPELVGFQGYSCVACHAWSGQMLGDPDPGAIGPDLARTAGRIRRSWFDRLLEDPLRLQPGTPMPTVFPRGHPALLGGVLDGDADRQRDALWSYLALGTAAPDPKPAPPIPLPAPRTAAPRVAQIPLDRSGSSVEAIVVHYASHDVFVYDLRRWDFDVYVGARLTRSGQGRWRRFHVEADGATDAGRAQPATVLAGQADQPPQAPHERVLLGYDRLADGVRIHTRATFGTAELAITEALHADRSTKPGLLRRRVTIDGVASDQVVRWQSSAPAQLTLHRGKLVANPDGQRRDGPTAVKLDLQPDDRGRIELQLVAELPPAAEPPAAADRSTLVDTGRPAGSLSRPGYQATEFPVPQSEWGEDLIMPSAVAVDPQGRVFVASMKLGELFQLADPLGDGSAGQWTDYARGLFQEAYSMWADDEGLFVLHRRNLTRLRDTTADGTADHVRHLLRLPHSIADAYDYGYGLVRDARGRFVFSMAPYASRHLPGSGGSLALDPATGALEELSYGYRNPLGWCVGPEGEIFFTDNQGEWVATNKLAHVADGHFHGFPNPEQPEHAERPFARPAVWVPYAWAGSINGVAYDHTQGRFGPFAGQFFLAELMFGGAIVRADVELVNGQYQGACFPFWGEGLLGPLTLAFHPSGPLFVGSITEPAWMAQPDRGALFRIDFTGTTPFEIHSIRVRPDGFQLRFTRPIDPDSAQQLDGYAIHHFRYEYTGAYGSPELDRTRQRVVQADVAADQMSVDLRLAGPLVPDRVYMIHAGAVRSQLDEPLVHPTGAYTLNEIPRP